MISYFLALARGTQTKLKTLGKSSFLTTGEGFPVRFLQWVGECNDQRNMVIIEDDVWLSCMTYLNKTETVETGENEFFLAIRSLGNIHLHTGNVAGSK